MAKASRSGLEKRQKEKKEKKEKKTFVEIKGNRIKGHFYFGTITIKNGTDIIIKKAVFVNEQDLINQVKARNGIVPDEIIAFIKKSWKQIDY